MHKILPLRLQRAVLLSARACHSTPTEKGKQMQDWYNTHLSSSTSTDTATSDTNEWNADTEHAAWDGWGGQWDPAHANNTWDDQQWVQASAASLQEFDVTTAMPPAILPRKVPTFEEALEHLKENRSGQRIRVDKMVELTQYPGAAAALAALVNLEVVVQGVELVFLSEELYRRVAENRMWTRSTVDAVVDRNTAPLRAFMKVVSHAQARHLVSGSRAEADAVYANILKCLAHVNPSEFLRVYLKKSSKRKKRTEGEHVAYLIYLMLKDMDKAPAFLETYLAGSNEALCAVLRYSKNYVGARAAFDTYLARKGGWQEGGEVPRTGVEVEVRFLDTMLRLCGSATRGMVNYYWRSLFAKDTMLSRFAFLRYVAEMPHALQVWQAERHVSPALAAIHLTLCFNRELSSKSRRIELWMKDISYTAYDGWMQHELFPVNTAHHRTPTTSVEKFMSLIRQTASDTTRILSPSERGLKGLVAAWQEGALFFDPETTLVLLPTSSLLPLYLDDKKTFRALMYLVDSGAIRALFVHFREEVMCRRQCVELHLPFLFEVPRWLMVHDENSALQQHKAAYEKSKQGGGVPIMSRGDPDPDRISLRVMEHMAASQAANFVGFIAKESVLEQSVVMLDNLTRAATANGELRSKPLEGCSAALYEFPTVSTYLNPKYVDKDTKTEAKHKKRSEMNSEVMMLRKANKALYNGTMASRIGLDVDPTLQSQRALRQHATYNGGERNNEEAFGSVENWEDEEEDGLDSMDDYEPIN